MAFKFSSKFSKSSSKAAPTVSPTSSASSTECATESIMAQLSHYEVPPQSTSISLTSAYRPWHRTRVPVKKSSNLYPFRATKA